MLIFGRNTAIKSNDPLINIKVNGNPMPEVNAINIPDKKNIIK